MAERLQKGQALLVVVLVVVVALTLGLSVATRSVTNVRISSEEKESQAAFSAAEAGIEQALKTSNTNGSFGSGGTSATYHKTSLSVNPQEIPVEHNATINAGQGVDIWLVPHTGTPPTPRYNDRYDGRMTVYWDSDTADACETAALEVIVVSGDSDDPRSQRIPFDPCPVRHNDNNFSDAHAAGASFGEYGTFHFKSDEITINNGIIARIIPLYKAARIYVTGNNDFSSQGDVIESIGVSGSTQRKVVAYPKYDEIPPEFQYVIYSAN